MDVSTENKRVIVKNVAVLGYVLMDDGRVAVRNVVGPVGSVATGSRRVNAPFVYGLKSE